MLLARAAGLGQCADRAGRVDAVHHGHRDVHQHHIEGSLADRAQCGLAIGCAAHLHLFLGQPKLEQSLVDPVVVNHQHARALERACQGRVQGLGFEERRHAVRDLASDDTGENASTTAALADAGASAHAFADLPTQVKPQAGAAILACGRCRGLGEGIENGLRPLGCDADTAVLDEQPEFAVVGIGFDRAHLHPYLALRREFQGVVDQVVDHLADAVGIAEQHALRRIPMHTEGQSLRSGSGREWPQGCAELLLHVEGNFLEFELASLDLGLIQQVVEQHAQQLARTAGRSQQLTLLGVDRRALEQVQHARHIVQWGADFMTHRGEHAVFGQTVRARLVQFGLQLDRAFLGDRPDEAVDAQHLAPAPVDRGQHELYRRQGAIGLFQGLPRVLQADGISAA